MLPRYYMDSVIISRFKSSTTHWCVTGCEGLKGVTPLIEIVATMTILLLYFHNLGTTSSVMETYILKILYNMSYFFMLFFLQRSNESLFGISRWSSLSYSSCQSSTEILWKRKTVRYTYGGLFNQISCNELLYIKWV